MNWRRWFVSAASAAALAGVLTSGAFAQEVTLTVGKLLELTGPLSENAPSQDKAIDIAVDYANQAAKAAGVPIKATAISADVQGDPQAALSAARALVAKGATALIGPSITPEAIAIANGLTIQKKMTMWPVGTSMRLRTIKDEGTIFRTVPPDSLQACALAAAVEDKLGDASGKLLSIAYRNEPYGEGLSKDLSAAWQAKGGKIQGPVVFDPTQATFDSEAATDRRQQSGRLRGHRLSGHVRQARRCACPNRQIRCGQACRSGRARLLDRSEQHSSAGAGRGAGDARRVRHIDSRPTSFSMTSGKRREGSSISRSTPTASIRQLL